MSKNKEETGPRITSVIVAGILSFILGKMLALGSLVSQPAEFLNKEPDPESVQPGQVWYVRGERAGRTAWQAKEDAWKAGAVDRLTLSEAELNQWSQDRLKQDQTKTSEEGQGWSDRLQATLTPANFRLMDGQVQVSTEVTFKELLPERSFLCVVVGRFEPTSSGVRFVPSSGTIGSAPLGSVPGYRELLYSYFVKQFEALSDLAWLEEDFQNLDSIEVSSGQLVLRRKAQG